MTRALFKIILPFVAAGFPGGYAASAAEVARVPEVVATIPSPGFNENISQAADGSFYITGAFEGILWKVNPDGRVEKLATFPNHAVVLGVVALPDGIAMGAFRRPFRKPEGVDFSDVGSEILILDKTGKVTATIPGQKGQVFNGMIADGRGKILVSDSQTSSIFQFDPATKRLELWLKDEALSAPSPQALGANGIKVAGDWVYVANKSRLSIYRVQIDASGRPKGQLALLVKGLPAADDFAVAPDGTLYVPPGDQSKDSPMTKVSPSGEMTPFVVAPFGASAMVSRDGKWVYWATGSGPNPQRLLRIAIP